jgi:ATP-binding cassette subfamily F protein 3
MIVFQANKINKWFGDRHILKDVSLSVNEHDRIGIVGPNGSGKTTFLRCLTGEIKPDDGQITVASGLSIGYLEQLPEHDHNTTAWDLVMGSFAGLIEQRRIMHTLEAQMAHAGEDLDRIMNQYARVTEDYERANGYACENFARRILVGLGFTAEQFGQPMAKFSGGQKTRLNLARLLAESPDLLLLDEPTNHLDIAALEWLEAFLRDYAGTVMVVSHDRMFLDRIANRIAELNTGSLVSYNGNYSSYLKQREVNNLTQQRAFERQQQYIQKTEEYIRRFKAGIKSKQARGRRSQLDRLQRLERPMHEAGEKSWNIEMSHESARDVMELTGIGKSFDGQWLLADISLKLRKGDKIALLGPNGSGKTTLLKMIRGEINPDQGEIKTGARVKMGYFAQEHEDLVESHTVLEEILYNFDLNLEQSRTWLGRMLFSEDDVFKKVGDLSGGERGRLSLLKLVLSGANFLLLDEPTNHLDIESREAVENMLADYPGTILFVSHDRFFIDAVAEQVAAIEDKSLQLYWGNYSYYHEKLMEQQAAQETEKKATQNGTRRSSQNDEQKRQQRLLRNLQRDLEQLEEEITLLEKRKTELENLLSDPLTYNSEERSRAINSEYREVQQHLDDCYQRWEEISDNIEASQPGF